MVCNAHNYRHTCINQQWKHFVDQGTKIKGTFTTKALNKVEIF